MHGYLPKDFIETAEGLVFAVVAAGEEAGRVLAFLRYRKVSGGYRKLSTGEANELLERRHPHYRFRSESRDVHLHGVPVERILHHHRPRRRLRELLSGEHRDGLERKLKTLLTLFQENGVDPARIGVTGSMLIGAHGAGSDIDLVFYHRESFAEARRIVGRLLAQGRLEPLDEALWRDAYARRGCSLSYDEFLWHERRKHNKAAIEQTKFDISLLPPQAATTEPRYRKQGRIRTSCIVSDDSRSFDYPARYALDDPTLGEVVSYTATYAGQACRGERVEIQGQLEVAENGHRRIIIGTDREAAGEYIKVLATEGTAADESIEP